MNFRSHLTGGASVSTVITIGYSFLQKFPIDQDDLALMFGACLVGSLAPDLDTQSKSSRYVSMFLFLFGVWSLIHQDPYPVVVLLVGFAFIKSMSHRTWCHVYSLPVILTGIALTFDIWWLIPFSIGLVCHYAIDNMNPLKLNNWWKPITIL